MSCIGWRRLVSILAAQWSDALLTTLLSELPMGMLIWARISDRFLLFLLFQQILVLILCVSCPSLFPFCPSCLLIMSSSLMQISKVRMRALVLQRQQHQQLACLRRGLWTLPQAASASLSSSVSSAGAERSASVGFCSARGLGWNQVVVQLEHCTSRPEIGMTSSGTSYCASQFGQVSLIWYLAAHT